MGNTVGGVFSTTVDVNCVGEHQDALTCAATSQARWGLTVLHLLVLTAVYTLAMIVHLIYVQIVDRRVAGQVRALPYKSLLGRKDTRVSRGMLRRILHAAADIGSDAYVMKPPASNLIQAPRGWGTGQYADIHFKTAIANMAMEAARLILVIVPEPIRLRHRSSSLRPYAAFLHAQHGIPRALTYALAGLLDRALYVDAYEFTADEFARARTLWTRLSDILRESTGDDSPRSSTQDAARQHSEDAVQRPSSTHAHAHSDPGIHTAAMDARPLPHARTDPGGGELQAGNA